MSLKIYTSPAESKVTQANKGEGKWNNRLQAWEFSWNGIACITGAFYSGLLRLAVTMNFDATTTHEDMYNRKVQVAHGLPSFDHKKEGHLSSLPSALYFRGFP